MTALEQIALGLPQAKKAVYDTMRTFYPNIDSSRSTLVNALVSGIAYLYSMFQVFVRMIADELYVSTATQLSSLYKLIPFVGIQLNQPTTLKITASTTVQDPSSFSSAPVLYPITSDPFIDASGYKFSLYSAPMVNQQLCILSSTILATSLSTDNTKIVFSIGRLLGAERIPFSMLIYGSTSDSFSIQVPYYKGSTLCITTITWTSTASLPTSTDGGTDVDYSKCYLDNYTGYVVIAFKSAFYLTSNLIGQPVNITYTQRSMYRLDVAYTNLITTPFLVDSIDATNPYVRTNLFPKTANKTSGQLTFHSSAGAEVTTLLLMIDHSTHREAVDPTSLQILFSGTIRFDFSQAITISDAYWGTIYQMTYVNAGTTYYAYVLDASIGLIAYEKLVGETPSVTFSIFSAFGSKLNLEQYEVKSITVAPPSTFKFPDNSYTLSDNDVLLFNNISIAINDPAYSSMVFQQVPDVTSISGNSSTAYFEVQPVDTTDALIRFDSSVPSTKISQMTFTYKVVKNLTSYPSGVQAIGNSDFVSEAGVLFNSGTVYALECTNLTSIAGVAGIPTLETLRDTLAKAAFTFDSYVTQLNYEYAVQNYFVQQGVDARLKVFDYSDFGTTFLDYTMGNIVFYMGVKNKFANSNPILIIDTDMIAMSAATCDEVGVDDNTGQYSRAQLLSLLPGALTDIGQSIVKAIGAEGTESDDIRLALTPYITMTNYPLSDPSFVRMYAVYFYIRIRPKAPYTYADAQSAVYNLITSYFSWSQMRFVRDLDVSAVYRDIEDLPQIDKALLMNMSHIRNDKHNGSYAVRDISYVTLHNPKLATYAFIPRVTYDSSTDKVSFMYNLNQGIAKFGGDATKIQIGLTRPSCIFSVNDYVNISGFADPLNNQMHVKITAVDYTIHSGYATITFGSGIFNSTETILDGVLFQLDTDQGSGDIGFVSQGIAIERAYHFSGAGVGTDMFKLLVIANNSLTVDPAFLTVVTENQTAGVIINNANTRLLNPVWDFSNVTSRQLYVDVLGLGGIQTEQY